MADFKTAYVLERKHEGNYVNSPADKGGETYGGVARKFWGSWSGWAVLDAWKAKNGVPKWNQFIAEMEPHVEAFYRNLWNVNRFGEIQNQEVANILYDWFINSGSIAFNTKAPETFGVDEILVKKFNQQVPVDGKLDTTTLAAINRVDSAALHTEIKIAREAFYKFLVAKNPSQSVFLKGWLARINSFPTLTKAGLGIGGILLGVGLFFLVRNYAKKS